MMLFVSAWQRFEVLGQATEIYWKPLNRFDILHFAVLQKTDWVSM